MEAVPAGIVIGAAAAVALSVLNGKKVGGEETADTSKGRQSPSESDSKASEEPGPAVAAIAVSVSSAAESSASPVVAAQPDASQRPPAPGTTLVPEPSAAATAAAAASDARRTPSSAPVADPWLSTSVVPAPAYIASSDTNGVSNSSI